MTISEDLQAAVYKNNRMPAEQILDATADLRLLLLNHPVYETIGSVEQLRIFMQHHVFAVYDFMWLLKRLQHDICSVTFPWLPPACPELARFINEIVLGEETDSDGRGGYLSHFQLYLDAMEDVGASPEAVLKFTGLLKDGQDPGTSLHAIPIPESVRSFVSFTRQLVTEGSTSQIAAAFCFGREDIIPEMFQRLLDGFARNGLNVPRLKYYIQRHIELDGDEHGPLTLQLVNRLCGESEQSIADAIAAARSAISSRIQLWDGVLQHLTSR